ncbi:MAG TPA: hypothetical protein VGQ98_05135, partial [Gemmatimonadaceae bacterium]|nr:hypothetical protein [Gemmatimonadaceae bacterium]
NGLEPTLTHWAVNAERRAPAFVRVRTNLSATIGTADQWRRNNNQCSGRSGNCTCDQTASGLVHALQERAGFDKILPAFRAFGNVIFEPIAFRG